MKPIHGEKVCATIALRAREWAAAKLVVGPGNGRVCLAEALVRNRERLAGVTAAPGAVAVVRISVRPAKVAADVKLVTALDISKIEAKFVAARHLFQVDT